MQDRARHYKTDPRDGEIRLDPEEMDSLVRAWRSEADIAGAINFGCLASMPGTSSRTLHVLRQLADPATAATTAIGVRLHDLAAQFDEARSTITETDESAGPTGHSRNT